MCRTEWDSSDIMQGYLEMAEINSSLAEEFIPLEEEAESSTLDFIKNL